MNTNWRTSGATLVEVILAVVILSTVGLSLALFAPKAIKAITKIHTRSVATSLASTKIEDTKVRPYGVIPITPNGPPSANYFSATSPIGPCDCSSADFTQGVISSETYTVGQTVYTRQTCVNYIQKTSLGTWQSNCTTDTAIKQVVVNVSWMLGSERQSFTMQSLASPPAQYGPLVASTGTYIITVCAADGNNPPGCLPGTPASIQNSEVAVYNASFVGENAAAWPTSTINSVPIGVPSGTGYTYTVSVQKTGFFPFYVTGSSVAVGATNNITAIMRDVATYGSNLAGEAFVANHPVISKVVTQVADVNITSVCTSLPGPNCQDLTEALEIYNPTQSTYTFGSGGNIQVAKAYRLYFW